MNQAITSVEPVNLEHFDGEPSSHFCHQICEPGANCQDCTELPTESSPIARKTLAVDRKWSRFLHKHASSVFWNRGVIIEALAGISWLSLLDESQSIQASASLSSHSRDHSTDYIPRPSLAADSELLYELPILRFIMKEALFDVTYPNMTESLNPLELVSFVQEIVLTQLRKHCITRICVVYFRGLIIVRYLFHLLFALHSLL
jgi:hypothetical protein